MAETARRKTALRDRRRGREAASPGGPLGALEGTGGWSAGPDLHHHHRAAQGLVAPIHNRMPKRASICASLDIARFWCGGEFFVDERNEGRRYFLAEISEPFN